MIINYLKLPVWLFKAMQEECDAEGKSVSYAIHKVLKEHYKEHNPNNQSK